MIENRVQVAIDDVKDAAADAELELRRLARIRAELRTALDWVASNADLPMGHANASLRLRQIKERAQTAIEDDRWMGDALPEELAERGLL